MPGRLRAPERNRHGLVIPPDPATVTQARIEYYGKRARPDRHHLYFPKTAFKEAGTLATEFREHRFNSIWLPRFQHDKLHRKHDPFVRKYPGSLIPDEDVMATFLDEAHILDELKVCVKAIDMIDEALYEGRVKHYGRTFEKRQHKVETAVGAMACIPRFEIVTSRIAQMVIADVAHIVPVAA